MDQGRSTPTRPEAEAQGPRDELPSNYDYVSSQWNLNNLPYLSPCLLNVIQAKINGINVPWMYFGQLFSTFCWHNEDSYLSSINYQHTGAPRTWYGVPGTATELLEKAFQDNVPLAFKGREELTQMLITMLSPRALRAAGVDVYRVLQTPGSFVVTFPKAFHGGFSHGTNAAEAVNFALPSWIPFGRDCSVRDARFQRNSVFAYDKLICSLVNERTLAGRVWERHAELLANELQRMADTERSNRDAIRTDGAKFEVAMPAEIYRAGVEEEDDDLRKCVICKQTLYLSAFICECKQTEAVCSGHFRHLCDCSNTRKCYVFWHSVEILDRMCAKVKSYVKYVQGGMDSKSAASLAFKPMQ